MSHQKSSRGLPTLCPNYKCPKLFQEPFQIAEIPPFFLRKLNKFCRRAWRSRIPQQQQQHPLPIIKYRQRDIYLTTSSIHIQFDLHSIRLNRVYTAKLTWISFSSASRFAYLTSAQPQYIADMLSGQAGIAIAKVWIYYKTLCFCLHWTFNNTTTGYSNDVSLCSISYRLPIIRVYWIILSSTTWRWFIPLVLFYCLQPTVGGTSNRYLQRFV